MQKLVGDSGSRPKNINAGETGSRPPPCGIGVEHPGRATPRDCATHHHYETPFHGFYSESRCDLTYPQPPAVASATPSSSHWIRKQPSELAHSPSAPGSRRIPLHRFPKISSFGDERISSPWEGGFTRLDWSRVSQRLRRHALCSLSKSEGNLGWCNTLLVSNVREWWTLGTFAVLCRRDMDREESESSASPQRGGAG